MAQNLNSAAMEHVQPTRFREGRPKSKNGCQTCKIRRVKCDETKPSCKRCETTGRTCDGYIPPAPRKVTKRSNNVIPREEISPISLYNPSVDISGSQVERRSFHYFRSRKMAELPGNFEPYFWDHLVLQFSHRDPTVRHSLIALSAIYESHEQESFDPRSSLVVQSRSLYVLEQYNNAIQHLASSITCANQDPRATLISCLIFVWIEFLRNDIDSGLQHLKCGLQIMQDISSTRDTPSDMTIILRQGSRDSDDIYGSLNRSFTRLSIQAAIHGSPTSDFTTSSAMPLFSKDPIPVCFLNIFESRNWLDNEMNSIFGHLRRLRDVNQLTPENNHPIDLVTLDGIRNSYLSRLQEWSSAAIKMAIAQSPVDKSQTSGVLYLQLYYTTVVIMLKTLFVETEMAFDEYTNEFERILSLADKILHNPHGATTPVLSFDMGVLPPLFFLALKCRVLRIRERAIVLMKLSPQQEGIWHRDSVVKTAELKLMLEEEGRGELSVEELLPCSARIFQEHLKYFDICGKRVAMMCYKRGRDSQAVEMSAELGEIAGLGDMPLSFYLRVVRPRKCQECNTNRSLGNSEEVFALASKAHGLTP